MKTRSYRVRPLLLAASLLPVLTGAAPVAQVQQDGSEIVYHWQKIVSRDGRATESTLVGDLARRLDSGEMKLDLERLVDDRGRAYELVADAWQESEEADVHYELKLLRSARTETSEAEIEADWRLAHPSAGSSEIETFRARLHTAFEPPPRQPSLSNELREWLALARPGDSTDVVIVLDSDACPLRLPKMASHLFESEPALALRQLEERLIAIEQRKNELEVVQAPLIDGFLQRGGEVSTRYWLINGFEARVSREDVLALEADPRVTRMEVRATARLDSNDLADMREAAQVVQLHDEGFRGETPSGHSSASDMLLAFIDDNIDADHPAWLDTAGGSSRLKGIWRYYSPPGVWAPVPTSATTTPSHGTKVVGIAMGDLTQGQDASVTSTSDRDARTGFAPEASFVFLEEGTAGLTESIEWATAFSPDVINLSMSSSGTTCDLSDSTNDAVDAAMLDGAFFAKSGGNNGYSGSSCVVGTPGAASGAFTVNQISASASPLQSGNLDSGASRGGDSIGRAVIAVAAYAGPEASTDAQVDNTYGTFGASSAATPVVAGSAAVLKEHLMTIFGSGMNDAGYLYASMLLMGDGRLESGATAGAQDEVDEVWGIGRLRMRMFNNAGMDAPWRMRLSSLTVSHGQSVTALTANPNSAGTDQALSSDVDRLRIAAFWHEPNIEYGGSYTAQITLSAVNESGVTYASGNSADHHQRINIGSAAKSHKWSVRLSGSYVPPSYDSDYYYFLLQRKVYVALYWEDGDRDDADGPSVAIQ